MVLDILPSVSDGGTQWTGGYNGPIKENADDGVTYKEIKPCSKKMMHWLERLATMIIEKKDPNLKERIKPGTKISLTGLPAGYRLYEQIRVTEVSARRVSDGYQLMQGEGQREQAYISE